VETKEGIEMCKQFSRSAANQQVLAIEQQTQAAEGLTNA
jgi:hypothetical protein